MRPLLTVFAAIVLLAGCGGSDEEEPPAHAAGITDLSSVEPLKEAFDAAEGKARLLLILDPT